VRAQDAALRALAEKASVEATRYLDDLANACTPGTILALLDRCEKAEARVAELRLALLDCQDACINADLNDPPITLQEAYDTAEKALTAAEAGVQAWLAARDERVRAEEREACAKMIEREFGTTGQRTYPWSPKQTERSAAAIRARAEQGER